MSAEIRQATRLGQQYLRNRNQSSIQHIYHHPEGTEIYATPQNKFYRPTPTGQLLHDSDYFVSGIMGPYGSGKTTACINTIIRRACAMPKWDRGQRTSRWAIVRNTSGELHSTTLQSWLTWFGELGEIKKRQKPLLTYEHQFNDGNGLVNLELIFIALDREDDVRKIKSLEVTGAYLNELCEIPQAALSHFKGRVNHRYPSRSFCSDPYWSGIIFDTNPPATDHWLYKDFEEKTLPNYKLFRQPPGLIKDEHGDWIANVNADNYQHLEKTYYTHLAEGQTTDFVKVFCCGEWGSVGFGKKVYPEFNSDLHCNDGLQAIQGEPIDLAWDFGLTPACVVTQLTNRGQLMVLKEYVGVDIGIKSFAENVVLPGIARDFPYCKVGHSVGDPSGANRDAIMDEMSCLGELNNLGVETIAARTNKIDARLGSVRHFLNKMLDGKPAFQLKRKNCPVLFKGFNENYCYKRIAVQGEERYRDEPDKNSASHIHDALQYRCLEYAAESIVQDKAHKPVVDMFNPVMRTF